jgi:uncharacterized membrane protein
MEKNGNMQKSSINRIIGRGLRTGVVLSGILMVIGFILYNITGDSTFPLGRVSIPWILAALFNLNPAAVIFLGILVLIATPVVRVLIAASAFFHEGDHIYTLIAIFVFIILMISFLMATT